MSPLSSSIHSAPAGFIEPPCRRPPTNGYRLMAGAIRWEFDCPPETARTGPARPAQFDGEGLTVFHVLRDRQNGQKGISYTPSTCSSWMAPTCAASLSKSARDVGQHPAQELQWDAPERAPGARLRPDGLPASLPYGPGGIVSKRLGSYRAGRSPDWLKFKNPVAPAVKREAEEDWVDHEEQGPKAILS
jgi:hypothetical protein